MSDASLHGKRAIITAGASGIGRVVASRLIADGARVAICDIDAKALDRVSAELPGSLAVRCDVSDPAAVAAVAAKMMDHLGGIDILVNNAGSAGPTAAVQDIEPADWDACIGVNMTSQFLFTRAVVPAMIAQRSGCIVNMSSSAGRFPMALRLPYVAAKWAVIGMTQSLAMELGPHNIRVNAILPGSVRGDRINRVMAARAASTGKTIAEIEREEVASMSMGRLIEPEEIATMIAFVASDAGRSISGQSLGVDGNTEVLR
ncbi:MAG: 3-oxoacyl-[acyl-carrier-protein] reductase [Rhodobacteraceae bacterium PARR1]|nr:MAG: 3-oxoacyl-[acyl-carrier-protein] reductase [Rhodobacteraceae bacterium PARR1]